MRRLVDKLALQVVWAGALCADRGFQLRRVYAQFFEEGVQQVVKEFVVVELSSTAVAVVPVIWPLCADCGDQIAGVDCRSVLAPEFAETAQHGAGRCCPGVA